MFLLRSAVLLACGLLASSLRAADAPALAKPAEVRLAFTGDIMLDMLPGAAIARGIDPFKPYASVFREADLVVGNLECVVATGGRQFIKPYTFRAHPRVVPVLDRWFDALSLANNHTGDFGDEALLEELTLFDGKVPVFGGGLSFWRRTASASRSSATTSFNPRNSPPARTIPALRGAWMSTSWPIFATPERNTAPTSSSH